MSPGTTFSLLMWPADYYENQYGLFIAVQTAYGYAHVLQ